MAQIRVLPDNLINKIAAGEVVERPASVVKELLENSLDAGARRVTIEVEGGGKRLIRVTDDGSGMAHDDALLAVERHATSKLHTPEDLLAISTLGFRGEALAAIASVCHFVLETRPQDQTAGTQIEIKGGRMRGVKEAGCPAGTQITVRRLFSNVPARRKFLRTDTTELGHVASVVTHYALAHPEISFTFQSGNHTILDAPPVASLQERVYQVLGRSAAAELIDLGRVASEFPAYRPDGWFSDGPPEPVSPGGVVAQGFVSRPEIQNASAKSIYIFINRRFVRDRVLLNAIREAYRHVLPPRAYPTVLLFLELPHSEVDVNVHPRKTEVRFRHQGFVHDFVQQALHQGLVAARPVGIAPVPPRVARARAATCEVVRGESARAPGDSFQLEPEQLLPQPQRLSYDERPPAGFDGEAVAEAMLSAAPASTAPAREALANLRPLGQLNNSFIVAVNEQGLWVIDQHVAHERVLFEQQVRERKRKSLPGQRMLMPVLVELTPGQQALWERIRAELEESGFEVDEMGPRTVAVKAAPAGIAVGEVEKLLREILDNVEKESRQLSLDALQQQIAASVACHAAIKVNMPLTEAKMNWLLDELSRADNPSTCPHGRPIVQHYSLREILKGFKRI